METEDEMKIIIIISMIFFEMIQLIPLIRDLSALIDMDAILGTFDV